MPTNLLSKYANQKREYIKRSQKHKDYQNQLSDYEGSNKNDFNFIKENIIEFEKGKSSSMTNIERQKFKMIKNRYYRNQDYCRFLKGKIERTV